MLQGCLSWVAFISVLAVIPAAAQSSPPSVSDTADRPGFADSPILLGRGHLQLESGFAWEHEGHSADLTRTFTWPQLELHAGLNPRLEVSVAWDGLVTTAATTSLSNAEGWSTGWADLRLGAKVGLLNHDKVDAALIGYARPPGRQQCRFVRLHRSRGPLRLGHLGLRSPWIVGDRGFWQPRETPMTVSGRNRRPAPPSGRPS